MQNLAHSSRRRTIVVAGAIVALAVLSFQSYAIIAGLDGANSLGVRTASGSTDPSTNSTVTVSGTGVVDIQPDIALITVGVITQDPSAQTATQQNAAAMNGVIAALEAIGINQTDIQTTSYTIQPQVNYDGNSGAQSISGYQVTNEVQVTVQASGASIATLGAKVGQAIDAAAGAGANDVSGVEFTASNSVIQAAENQALQLAVQNAAAQAKVIASALGESITGVISVDANQGYPTYVSDQISAGTASTPIVAPQSLQISASVQSVYSIG